MNSPKVFSAIASIADWLLGFYQSAVTSLLNLFTSGHSDTSLSWLTKSWFALFVFILILGVALNLFIYMIRWKPHWWWFAKRRMVVDDALLEAKPKKKRSAKSQSTPRSAKPVKPSTIVKRNDSSQSLTLSTIAPSRLTDDTDALFSDPSDDLMTPRKPKNKKSR